MFRLTSESGEFNELSTECGSFYAYNSPYSSSNGFGQVRNDGFVSQRQELTDYQDEHHHDESSNRDLNYFLDSPHEAFPTPPPFRQGSATQSPELSQVTSRSTPSPISPISSATLSSGTVTGQSQAKVGTQFRIVEYNHKKPRKRPAARCSQNGKLGAKERKSRGLASRSDVLKTETAPKTSIRRDANGKIAGTMTIFGLSQVVREPVSKEQRLATSVTRRVGACPRCHKHRLRCDMPGNSYEPCARCATQLANFYLRNEGNFQCQPAIRINLLDLQLHRKGPTINDDLSNWVQGKQILQRYQKHHDIHHLFLTQTHAEGLENALCVPVSRFDPQPGDRTAYNWTDLSGNLRSMEVPPFYISDLREASQGIRQFVHSVRSIYIEALLADSNPLIRQTFQAALTYATFNQTGLVTEALETWVSARLIETQWHVYAGGVEIGLEPKDEPGHPWHNITPVTPIMDSQLDDIVIRDLLVPHTHFFLRRLKAKIDEQKRENWLEIYFAMFIMMSNVGWILKDMAANAAWKGLKPGSRGGRLTQGYIHACKSMLAYFHFTCAGSLPLSVIMDEDSNLPGITPEQIEYLQCAREEMARQGEKLSKWKDLSMYDDDGYWCYQMLCRDWKGDVPHAGDIDDFTEEDFLSSST